jgi:tRNA pseudouridine55 synthase
MVFCTCVGLLAVFKPKGITSNDAVQIIKVILNSDPLTSTPATTKKLRSKSAIKVGHGGTLDPLAEGILVLGIGAGTKNLTAYLAGSKAYVATGLLGAQTDTLDSTGTITGTKPFNHVSYEMINSFLKKKYTGTFPQLPPMFSALKRDGVALYKSAREGIEIERDARPGTLMRLPACLPAVG